jgi:signal transduction histidine kinase
MGILESIKIDEQHREIALREFRELNLHRIYNLSFIAVPLSLIHIILFYWGLNDYQGIEYQWRSGIINSHIAFCSLTFLLAIISKKLLKSDETIFRYGSAVAWLAYTLILLIGVVITAIDQLVTPSITPFIFACTISSLIFLVYPLYSGLLYLGIFVLYFLTLNLTQTDPQLFLTNAVNGLTAVSVGFGISFLMWRTQIIRLNQRLLIEKQKKEIQENYDKLLVYSNELKLANATKDKFFSIVTHDLRSPLVSINSALEMLDNYGENGNNALLDALKKSSQSTNNLLESIMIWSKNQVGLLKFEPELLSLKELVNENINLLGSVANEKDIELINDASTDTTVFADKEMLKTILRNLISNAIKFTNPGGVVRLRTLNQDRNTKKLTIIVEDNGVGMDEKTIKKLFKIEEKSVNVGTKGEKGSGMGLILCREFVQRHSGIIWVESDPGIGSKIYFEIPTNSSNQVN